MDNKNSINENQYDCKTIETLKIHEGVQCTVLYSLKHKNFETIELSIGSNFDKLRSICVIPERHNLNKPICKINIGSWEKILTLNESYKNFSEQLLPNHEDFSPVKLIFYTGDSQENINLRITGIILNNEYKQSYIKTFKLPIDYYSFGFTKISPI